MMPQNRWRLSPSVSEGPGLAPATPQRSIKNFRGRVDPPTCRSSYP